MTGKKDLPWPFWALALDIVGTLLLALGLYGHFGANEAIKAVGIPLIVVGVLLTLPFLVILFRQAGRRR